MNSVLHSMCDVILRIQLETKRLCQEMVKERHYCEMKLHMLIRKNCNGSTCVVVDGIIGTRLESMCSMMMIRVDEYDSLPKFLEVTENKCQAVREFQFGLENEGFRD